jgi:hypothetical protein
MRFPVDRHGAAFRSRRFDERGWRRALDAPRVFEVVRHVSILTRGTPAPPEARAVSIATTDFRTGMAPDMRNRL